MAKYPLNDDAVAKARTLIDARQYVLDSDWGEVQPRADAQNSYLESHSWEEYAEWHLGLTDGANDETKARYAFVYGDFRRIHRTGLIACVYRAAEWRHKDIEVAAHDLLQYLDKKTGLEPTRKRADRLRPQHEVQEAVAQFRGRGRGRARCVQEADARREHHKRAQCGVVGRRTRSRRTPAGPPRSTRPSLCWTLASAALSVSAHTRIARSSAQCCGATSVCIITARRSRGSTSGMFSNGRRLRSWRLPHASTSALRYAGMSVKCQ